MKTTITTVKRLWAAGFLLAFAAAPMPGWAQGADEEAMGGGGGGAG